MGLSKESYGKKSDKSTHTPMLKIFKDIMQKENNDPEKINLLKEEQGHRKERTKRRQYPECDRLKSDTRTNGPSIGTDKQQRCTQQYTIYRQRSEHDKSSGRSNSRSSADIEAENEKDDTCSCASCALNNIGTEYIGVVAMTILLAVSVAVVSLIVIPLMSNYNVNNLETTTNTMPFTFDSEMMSRKLQKYHEKGGDDRKHLDNVMISPNFNGLSAYSAFGGDFGEVHSQDSVS